jgi:hypothetical protein
MKYPIQPIQCIGPFAVAIRPIVDYYAFPTAFSEGYGIMELHKGTHGTCKSRAIVISEKGFEIFNSNPRRGNGVYFWRDNSYAVEFAKAWYKQELKNRKYDFELLKTCSIIKADIKVEDDEIVNVDDPIIKDLILKIVHEKHIDNAKGVCSVYDNYIKSVERRLNKSIKLVLAQVRVPESDFPRTFIETAYCYVVRSIDCIHITAIDHYDERYVKC